MKLTQKHKENIRKGMLGKNKYKKTIKHRQKISKTLTGRKMPEKTRQKIRDWAKTKEGQELLRNNALNTLSKLKKSKISKAEIILKNYLVKNNMNFIHQWKYKYGIADFFLPDFNMIIECDGEYWHSKPDSIKRDKKKRAYLKRKGYIVFIHSSEKLVKKEEYFK